MSDRIRPWRRRDKKHLKRKKHKPAKRNDKPPRDILEELPPVE